MSVEELRCEKADVMRELKAAVDEARRETCPDRKEVIFERVFNLAACSAELRMLINPSLRIRTSEAYCRKLCGFPKNEFMNP
jgi:hypothetical protein